MKYFMYVNYNRKVEAFERPIFRLEDCDEYIETVGRDFKASDPTTQARIAEYNFIHCGYFDDNTGKITMCEPNVILNGSSLLEKEEKVDGQEHF